MAAISFVYYRSKCWEPRHPASLLVSLPGKHFILPCVARWLLGALHETAKAAVCFLKQSSLYLSSFHCKTKAVQKNSKFPFSPEILCGEVALYLFSALRSDGAESGNADSAFLSGLRTASVTLLSLFNPHGSGAVFDAHSASGCNETFPRRGFLGSPIMSSRNVTRCRWEPPGKRAGRVVHHLYLLRRLSCMTALLMQKRN
jgi:hypothetical protein